MTKGETMSRFKDNPELRAKAATVFKLLSSRGKGDVLKWTEVEEATGLQRDWANDPLWVGAINKARKQLLRDFHIVTWVDNGVGVRLLTDSEVARDQSARRLRKSRNQCSRGMKEIRTITLDALPMHERRLAVAGMDAMEQTRATTSAALREGREAIKAAEPLPRIK